MRKRRRQRKLTISGPLRATLMSEIWKNCLILLVWCPALPHAMDDSFDRHRAARKVAWFLKNRRHIEKQGNRLTRRPCKGDEFEILIFEAKRQNAGICRSRQKMFATWTFISIGRRVTQEWKFEFRLRGDSIFLFKGEKKTLEFYDFKSSKSHQSRRYSILFFFHCSRLAVPECLWQCWCYSL